MHRWTHVSWTGQCWGRSTDFLFGGSILVRCSGVSTCSKDSPLICHRDRQTEIDDHVGKWQAGEKLTCKWCRERERRGRGLSFCASVVAGKGNMCGVSSWQLSSSSTSAWEGRGGSLFSFSPPLKKPYPVAWCCCHGVGLFWKGEREQKLWVAVNIIGKGAIISLSLAGRFSLVVSWPLKIPLFRHSDSI